MKPIHVRSILALASLTPLASAQGPVFQTPGMPQVPSTYSAQGSGPDASQAGRFSSVFNPAFSFIVDALLDERRSSGEDDEGTRLELRTLELAAQSWIDPNAWAYFIAATDGETLNVEEAAVHYVGLGNHNTIRAGRFFIDFGKQMQTHVHELRTVERPLVLRAFLGDEVKGDGAQWDAWTSIGDETAVRWSIGVFQDLLPEETEDFDASTSPARSVAERKRAEDLNVTARLTAFTDVGEQGVFQAGVSARVLPNYAYAFEPSGARALGLENAVLGLDLTYGWTSDTGLETWTFGGEYLVDTGDTYAEIDDSGTAADATDDTLRARARDLSGFFVYADHQWSRAWSAGIQFSRVDLPETGRPDAAEIDVYVTHSLSEFHRLRFDVTSFDRDDGDDSLRFALQYTAIVGAHGHGVNW